MSAWFLDSELSTCFTSISKFVKNMSGKNLRLTNVAVNFSAMNISNLANFHDVVKKYPVKITSHMIWTCPQISSPRVCA